MNSYEEAIDFINQIDTAHLLTYFYACLLIVSILLAIYCILVVTFTIICSKKRAKYLATLDDETKKKVLEYRNINIFTKVK